MDGVDCNYEKEGFEVDQWRSIFMSASRLGHRSRSANRCNGICSLQVMASLVRRERLAWKVQMIYNISMSGVRFSTTFGVFGTGMAHLLCQKCAGTNSGLTKYRGKKDAK